MSETTSASSCQTESCAPKGGILGWLMPLAGVAVLAFFFGMVIAIKQSPPFHLVRDAWLAYCSMQEQQGIMASETPRYMWYPTASTTGGLLSGTPQDAQGDYTVFTAGDECCAKLLDREGNVVHQWDAPYSRVFPNSTVLPRWVPEPFVLMRRALVYPNGDLLALYETIANSPTGCGLAKLDVEGNVLWKFEDHTHHDVCLDEAGNIYVLVNRIRHLDESDEKLKPLTTIPLIEDLLVVLSPEGEELQRMSLLDALVDSPFFREMLIHVDRYGDITHNNTVSVVGEEFAAHYPEVSPDDVMVCHRNLNLVTIINLRSEKMVWATTGPWEHPHDPDPLPNGNILIFDNFVAHGAQQGSAVVEFDPRTRQIAWQYHGTPERHLASQTRCCQQLLSGGNVLITEADQGRILEVDRQGNTVWEYVHPRRGGENDELIPTVVGARRYELQQVPFLQKVIDVPAKGSELAVLTKQEN